MIDKLFRKILKAIKIIGFQASSWFGVGVFAGLLLSFVEIQLAVFIQLFLQSLGFKIDLNSSFLGFFSQNYSFGTLMFILGILGILRSFSQFLVSQSACVALETINARLRLLALHDLLLNSKYKYVSAAETNARFGEIFPKTGNFFYYLAQCIPQIIVATVVLLILFKISFPAAVLGLIGLMAIASFLYFINRWIGKFARAVPVEQSQLLSGVERVTRNWLLVRVLRTHNSEYNKLSKNVLSYAWHGIRANTLVNLGSATPSALGVFLLVGIILASVHVFHTPSSQIITFLYLFLRLVQTLSTIASQLGSSATFFPQAKMTAQYFQTFSDEDVKNTTDIAKKITSLKSKTTLLSHVKGAKPSDDLFDLSMPSIKIEEAWFRYDHSHEYILRNLTLSINPGEQLAIIGRSGSGKSTLLALIFGLLKVEKGSVLIDNLEASEYFNRFSGRIAYVGAEPFLIEGSIQENLDYGSNRLYTNDEYRSALQEASLWNLVQSLNQGMKYKIEENGSGLSAGQKQRLSIARALLRHPRLLILDEVTANLDVETEHEITGSIALLKGKCTVVMISHRPEAIQFADRVINLSSDVE